MKRLTTWLGLTALLLVLGPAQAEPPQGRGEGKSRPEATSAERRDEARENREGRRDEQGNRPPPRLSAEERRELRQQIHEAGHDVYHRPKRQAQQ